MKILNVLSRIVILAVVVLAIGGLCSDVSAQTRKKKSTTKVTPKATPTPPVGDVEIVSRADDPPKVFMDPAASKPIELPVDDADRKINELASRLQKLESSGTKDPDQKQKRMLLNLDILTRAESRADGLRKQLYEMIEKENAIKARIDQIDTESRPEAINRSAAFSGSMKPEEVREMRKKSLDAEKQNLQSLLTEIQSNRANLAASVQRADAMVEKLRAKLEKEIDDALVDDKPDQ